MDGSNNSSFLLGPGLFSEAFAVSFREGILTNLGESITSGSRRMWDILGPIQSREQTNGKLEITIFHSRCIFIRGCLYMVRLVIGGVSFHHGLRKNKSDGALGGAHCHQLRLGETHPE